MAQTRDIEQDRDCVIHRDHKDIQLAALLVSAAVVVGFAIYWSLQIQSVREMLALAYG
jgi:hypothetical protein